MAPQKIIAVLGATGNQGGSVVNVFLQDPNWRVRGITRNPKSSKASALVERGVEVVQADLDDPASLIAAFDGAHAVFAVSDFWGIYGDPQNQSKPAKGQALNEWAAQHETQQLRNVIDVVAKLSTLERFVLSSLSDATRWSKGKYPHVFHFDSKAIAERYGKDTYPELWQKTSIFQAGFFVSNLVGNPILRPVKTSEGGVEFPTGLDPDVKLPWIVAEEDSGPLVKSLVEKAPGKNLIGYREWKTFGEFVQIFNKATGNNAVVHELPKGEFAVPLPDELKLELTDNWAYWNEFGYEGRDDATIIHPRQLESAPRLASIEDYLRKQDWAQVLAE